jgi:trk system potassium uptake protein TrkH
MNTRYVLNFLGKLLILLSFAFIPPVLTAYYYDESLMPFLVSIVASLVSGSFLYLPTRSVEQIKFETIRYKEAFAIVSLSWLFVSIIGAVPYVVVGVGIIDAFFESMSGFTTTGASVLIPEKLPKSILLWRSMTQWLGGMGIIVLFLAIFPSVARRGAPLFQAEYPGVILLKVKPRLRDTAVSLYKVYLFLTALEIAVLMLLGLSFFDAVNHTFTTLSTGGYSTHSESIAYFKNVNVEIAIAFFAALGGTNFALLYYLARRDFRILKDAEFKVYLSFLAFFALVLILVNLDRYDILNSMRYSMFQAVSIMTTTGYTTADFDMWNDSARFLMIVLMFIGGCSGSTAGGIKIVRIYLLLQYAVQQIMRTAEPRTIRSVKYGKKVLRKEQLEDLAAFFVLYVFIFVLSSMIVALSGYDILTSISATAATLGNVGPGLGLAGAGENYSGFSEHVKLLLTLNMWVGRLEIFTVISLFIPSFWREKW